MKSLIAKLSIRIKKILIKFKILKPKGVYYMGGVNVLPPPLNSDEESELLQRLEKDEEVKTILIERNLRLVVYISRKFENSGIDIEDLISIGTIGLIKAVNTFKLNKNIKFREIYKFTLLMSGIHLFNRSQVPRQGYHEILYFKFKNLILILLCNKINKIFSKTGRAREMRKWFSFGNWKINGVK